MKKYLEFIKKMYELKIISKEVYMEAEKRAKKYGEKYGN